MRSGRRVLVVVAVLAALAGSALAESVTIVDTAGRTVSVPQPVERIVSTYGIGTYYVYALGAGDRLVAAWYVGVKSASQAPASFRALEPRLDELLRAGDPNVEDVVALGTDFVMADGARHASFAEKMQGLGVPALLLAAETAQGVVDTIFTLGAALGDEAQARAASLAADFYRVYGVAAVAASGVPSESRPRVLFLGSSSLQVASGAMYQTQLIEAAGGVSVSADLSGSWNTVSLEQILVWNPDVIVIPPYGSVTVADILGSEDWQSVSAVRAGRVLKMPRVFGTMDTPLPESLLGVVWLSSVFYPERAIFDARAEAADFYQTYYGYTLSSAEADAFLIP
jgi:iron complex transport system substrate-binding protein